MSVQSDSGPMDGDADYLEGQSSLESTTSRDGMLRPRDHDEYALDCRRDVKSGLRQITSEVEPYTSRLETLSEDLAPLPTEPGAYRVYKRRFTGLAQLILLNIMISWGWLTFAAVSTTTAHFFDVSVEKVSWLSTAVLFAFVPASPVCVWALNRYGPKHSIMIASVLFLLGNWIRYGGVRASPPSFAAVIIGQLLTGLAQPFVLTAPTRYSNMWFSDVGRVSATAVASLANPFGAALGQLIGPFWATDAKQLPSLILYTAIISTAVCLPAPFIPREPPTPPSAIAASEMVDVREACRLLPKNISFWLILVPFTIYVAFFNAFSSLLNQILFPWGFSETDAGVAGGLLIIVGLVASAIVSPWVDRSRYYALTIKILVPCIAGGYLVFIWMPATRSIVGPWVICAVLGATSFSLLPCVLEFLVLVTHPVSPEITSNIVWSGGQLFGAIFIIIMNTLQGGLAGEPKDAMTKALIFEAVIAILAVPAPMLLGVGKRREDGIAYRNGLAR